MNGVGTTICPGCGNTKSKRAELCAACRKAANELGASVLQAVATPAQPFVPRTPKQNTIYHGMIRTLTLLDHPGLEGGDLIAAERQMKRRVLGDVQKLVGRPVVSSTELSELEMQQVLDWLEGVIDSHTLR